MSVVCLVCQHDIVADEKGNISNPLTDKGLRTLKDSALKRDDVHVINHFSVQTDLTGCVFVHPKCYKFHTNKRRLEHLERNCDEVISCSSSAKVPKLLCSSIAVFDWKEYCFFIVTLL